MKEEITAEVQALVEFGYLTQAGAETLLAPLGQIPSESWMEVFSHTIPDIETPKQQDSEPAIKHRRIQRSGDNRRKVSLIAEQSTTSDSWEELLSHVRPYPKANVSSDSNAYEATRHSSSKMAKDQGNGTDNAMGSFIENSDYKTSYPKNTNVVEATDIQLMPDTLQFRIVWKQCDDKMVPVLEIPLDEKVLEEVTQSPNRN